MHRNTIYALICLHYSDDIHPHTLLLLYLHPARTLVLRMECRTMNRMFRTLKHSSKIKAQKKNTNQQHVLAVDNHNFLVKIHYQMDTIYESKHHQSTIRTRRNMRQTDVLHLVRNILVYH